MRLPAPGSSTADGGVGGTLVEHAAVTIRHGEGARHVGADEIAFDHVVAGNVVAATDTNAVDAIARDNVARFGGRAANGIARILADVDAVALIAQGNRARGVRADEVAFDQVVMGDEVGCKDAEFDARVEVAGNDVSLSRCRSADGIVAGVRRNAEGIWGGTSMPLASVPMKFPCTRLAVASLVRWMPALK